MPINQYFIEDLAVGQTEKLSRTVTEALINAFAEVSGDNNPVHLDAAYAATTQFGERIAHGALASSFISAVLGTRLPGIGAIYVSQTTKYRAPVRIGDTVETIVTVKEIDLARKRAVFTTDCFVGETKVVTGEATLMVASRAA
ncbi:MaoC family dehydratase [Pseudokordiimonas caeni]|uniref:MaoC family dehydratase n=1 Tax=Pseudokordiimonas caeni TaxID=2997908 RepID=UPI0028111FC0|nr:MaoC family dehydratase [Pseudokordiimonas caeni]